MLIVKLTGGLGNQLFQYANGRAISIKNKTPLLIDASWYKGRIDRQYLLDKYNIKSRIATKLEIFLTKIFNKKNYIQGDFQSEKYFENIKNIISEDYSIKEPIKDKEDLINKIKSTNSVSIHMRGGDYVRGKRSSFHGTCSPEYYYKAIEEIKLNIDSPFFFIFTDDIPWAKNHIKFPEPNIFISNEENKPYEEIILMSYCKNNIIANSTFSWWGAWLNNNKNKIVIAPKKWFNNDSIDTKDILPKQWIKI
jgi:hypothetical protein